MIRFCLSHSKKISKFFFLRFILLSFILISRFLDDGNNVLSGRFFNVDVNDDLTINLLPFILFVKLAFILGT